MPDTKVLVAALGRVVFADSAGKFHLAKVPAGIYTLTFSYVGYKPETRTVDLAGGNAVVAVSLYASHLDLPSLTVTAAPQPTDVLSSPLSVTVLEGRELEQKTGETVIRAIDGSPGVTLLTTGSGLAKPVIRGLTGSRVLVLSDGVRQEGQQWGDEQSPELDPLGVERIEIVRGPGSVLYGSDALGGVINVIRPEVPSADEGAPALQGNLLLHGFSNNSQGAGGFSAFGAKGSLGYRGNFSYRKGKDIATPNGRLSNSGSADLAGGVTVGTKKEWGTLVLDASHITRKEKIHEDPADIPTPTPEDELGHDRVRLHGNFPFSKLRLEATGGWQRNDLKEFDEGEEKGMKEQNAPLHLLLNTLTFDAKAHHLPFGKIYGTIGFSLMQQNNKTSGTEQHLIPGFDLLNLAGFIYEEARLQNVTFSGGVRFDARSLDAKEDTALNVSAQSRNFHSATGTAGAVWHVAAPVALAANVGRGWRAPTAFELFVNGVHEGLVRFERGDSTMKPEESLNFDFSVRYASPRFQVEATAYRNRISRFIFASPTGQTDTASGFPIFQRRQADATFLGGEFMLKAQAAEWLLLSTGVDLVRGTNDQTDQPLPFIPAHRLKLGARLLCSSWKSLKNLYFSLGSKLVADQKRVAPNETPTSGYALFDAGMGTEIPLGFYSVHIDLAVENFLDRAYRDHLSRYKEYALNPGRNIVLKLSLPLALAH